MGTLLAEICKQINLQSYTGLDWKIYNGKKVGINGTAAIIVVKVYKGNTITFESIKNIRFMKELTP